MSLEELQKEAIELGVEIYEDRQMGTDFGEEISFADLKDAVESLEIDQSMIIIKAYAWGDGSNEIELYERVFLSEEKLLLCVQRVKAVRQDNKIRIEQYEEEIFRRVAARKGLVVE